ncbi:porin [Aquisalimonas lutea]|uniref:porin n=1 Tax=Aquisalimonas lutea TaxID=1327750 RepID=UPI0025B42D22|nr:porin [Aquisalimonas lutea]MDN3516227.1 porin [Aquisalimonas lutea]
MKKVTSALALAALIGSPAAFAQVEFGGDAEFNAYNVRNGAAAQSSDRTSGMQQRIRLQAAFETDGGVEVHTRLNLFNDRWTGDASGDGGLDEQPFSNRDHRGVDLDLGYISLPIGIGRMNIGRQASNWNHNFTASDDRRDRIGFVIPLGGGHVFAPSYDRRTTDQTTATGNNAALDGNQLNLAVLGPLAQGMNYGVLYTRWESSDSGAGSAGYALRGAQLFAPYVAGEAGNFDYKVGGHYLGDSRGSVYTENTYGTYLRGGFQLTPEFKAEAQVMYMAKGTLVAGGYDTFSSLIHNSPDHSQSPTRIGGLNLGGQGTGQGSAFGDQTDDTRTLVAARGTYDVMDWTFMGAVGWVNYELAAGTAVNTTANDVDEDVMFADLQAHYSLTPSTTVYATAGYAQTEDYFNALGMREKDSYATSLNVETQF